MTTRTLKFYGRGYGETPAAISVTQNGVNVYTGEITTINAPRTDWPDQVVLFTSETTVDFTGTISMSIEVTNGTVVFAWITGNYCSIVNPVYSDAQLEILRSPTSTQEEKIAVYSAVAVPPFSSEELAILETGTALEKNAVLESHNAMVSISSGSDEYHDIYTGDERSSVEINGVLQSTPDPRPADQTGTWFWLVNQGSVLTYDLNVSAGKE
jgi:hypothetical protein